MTSPIVQRPQNGDEASLSFGSLDADSAARIDVHLQRAQDAEDAAEKDFHLRHARQLLEACTEH